MPTSLLTGLSREYPVCIAPTENLDVAIANGMQRWRRWDGKTASGEIFGVGAVSSGVASLTPGAGGGDGLTLLATYYAALQFVDRDGVAGNLCGIQEVELTGSNNYIDWGFASIGIYAPTRATHVKLWRSLAGDPSVFYLVSTEAISGIGTVNDGTPDDEHAANEALVVVNENGNPVTEANRRGMPPSHMSSVIQFGNRLYAAVPRTYTSGMVEVTNGSTAVTGVGTNWPYDSGAIQTWGTAASKHASIAYNSPQATQKFQVFGDTTEYDVSALLSATSITLGASYAGTTSNFARYSIYPTTSELLRVYYTWQNEPESWPATYYLTCYAHGGPLTALVDSAGYLYLAKRAHSYKFSVNVDPLIDGQLYRDPLTRGCENQRTWCKVDGVAYSLDRQGVHVMSGGEPREVADQIGDLFTNGKINWRASRFFHLEYDEERSMVMAFVSIGSGPYPNTALCYNTRTQNWSEERFPRQVASSKTTVFSFSRKTLLGEEHAKVQVASGDTKLDGVPANTPGTLRGMVDSATLFTITDSTASFSSTLVGAPLSIIDGRGKRQTRRISAVDAATGELTTNLPWLITPDSTSEYQIGGFEWVVRMPNWRLTQRAADTTREVTIKYEPTDAAAYLFLRLYRNRNRRALMWSKPGEGTINDQIGIKKRGGDVDLRLDLDRRLAQARTPELSEGDSEDFDQAGFRRVKFDGNTAVYGEADRTITAEIWGHQGEDGVTIYGVGEEGVR